MKHLLAGIAALAVASSPAIAAELLGNWVFGETSDAVTGQTGAAAGVNSDDGEATIGLKCDVTVEGNPITFLLRVPRSVYLLERPLVTVRVDGRQPLETYWYRATSDGAVMFPGSEVRKWSREMAFGNDLLLRVRDIDNQVTDFRFKIAKPEQVFRKVYAACGAKADHLKPAK